MILHNPIWICESLLAVAQSALPPFGSFGRVVLSPKRLVEKFSSTDCELEDSIVTFLHLSSSPVPSLRVGKVEK